MTSLQRFEQNGIELVIDTKTGEAFATERGYAKMSGLTQQGVNKRTKGNNCINIKKAEILTPGGLQVNNLIPSSTVFRWLMKDNPELAEKMGEAGATVYMHQLAGYKVVSEIAVPKTYAQALMEAAKLAAALEESEMQNQLLTAENAGLLQDVEELSEVVDELFDYSSIIRIAKYNNCDEKSFSWHKLKAASNKLNVEIKKAPCPRFGTKNIYSHDAWRLAYPGYRLPETTTLTISRSSGMV